MIASTTTISTSVTPHRDRCGSPGPFGCALPGLLCIIAPRLPAQRKIDQLRNSRFQIEDSAETNHSGLVQIRRTVKWKKLPSAVVLVMSDKMNPVFLVQNSHTGKDGRVWRIFEGPTFDRITQVSCPFANCSIATELRHYYTHCRIRLGARFQRVCSSSRIACPARDTRFQPFASRSVGLA